MKDDVTYISKLHMKESDEPVDEIFGYMLKAVINTLPANRVTDSFNDELEREKRRSVRAHRSFKHAT